MLSSLLGGVVRVGAEGVSSSSPLPKKCMAGAAWGFAVLSSANTSSGSGTAGLSGLASGSFSGPGFWTAGASGTLFSGFSASG